MRWGAWSLAVAVLVAGCGGSDSGGEPASGGDQAVRIERVDVDVPLSGSLVAVGDVLVVGSNIDLDRHAGPFRSRDLGESWETIELPGAPANTELGQPKRLGDLVVVTGSARVERADSALDRGEVYLWSSRDGIEWRGGRVPSDPLVSDDFDLTVHAVGDRLVAGVVGMLDDLSGELALLYSVDGGETWSRAEMPDLGLAGHSLLAPPIEELATGPLLVSIETRDSDPGGTTRQVLLSDDDGASWRIAPCPPEATLESGACEPPRTIGPVQVHGGAVSVDGGATWQEPQFEPPIDPEHPDDRPGFPDDAVQLPGGSWLAGGDVSQTGDQSIGYLTRSDDGVHWQQLLTPDPCHARDLGRPNSGYSNPLRLGDRWLVTYTCVDLMTPVWSDLYLVSPDGTGAGTVPDAHLDRETYGRPVIVGDTAVMLVDGLDDTTVAVARVRL